jgi:hypothetical protein
MSANKDRNAGASRDQARARLRTLTNAALLATTGATVGIAVVVAHEHPGKSAAGTSTRSTVANTGSSGASGTDGNTGTSSTANTGNSGSSSSPSVSSQSPAVTSGGSARR